MLRPLFNANSSPPGEPQIYQHAHRDKPVELWGPMDEAFVCAAYGAKNYGFPGDYVARDEEGNYVAISPKNKADYYELIQSDSAEGEADTTPPPPASADAIGSTTPNEED